MHIYSNNWIPRPTKFRPISIITLLCDTVVSELINNNQSWNLTKVYHHFRKEDAYQIVSIPLPQRPKIDQIFWHYDKKDNYSVKSGFQIAQKIKFQKLPSCSVNKQGIWKNIWASTLPEKIKIFMWRLSKTYYHQLKIYGGEK